MDPLQQRHRDHRLALFTAGGHLPPHGCSPRDGEERRMQGARRRDPKGARHDQSIERKEYIPGGGTNRLRGK
eukprot:4733175-Pyramimonas_sp.AAC.1